MQRATLIFNPHAGRRRDNASLMPALIRALDDRGVVAEVVETTGPGIAGTLASLAANAGVEIVFACGGDGTVHETLQGIVGTSTVLGIVPIGTANALARSLKISREPVEAAIQQVNASSIRIPVGQVSYGDLSVGRSAVSAQRYFTVMAGAGPDGALVHSLQTGQKSAMGRTAYYAHAGRLFLTKSFTPFRVTYRRSGESSWQEEIAVSAITSRIDSLGGIFSRLTPGSSFQAQTIRLFITRAPAIVSLPAWFVSGQLGMHRVNPWLRVLDVEEFRCETLSSEKPIHAQVDGESIGELPIAVRLIPDCLLLAIPKPTACDSLKVLS